MAEDEEKIDFISLEIELNQAVQDDIKYWEQNDAKIRAVNQRVATYNDFRGIVDAAHLKPLDKKDSLGLKAQSTLNNCIWNSVSSAQKTLIPSKHKLELEEKKLGDYDKEEGPETTVNLLEKLCNASEPNDRYNILKSVAPEVIKVAFRSEVPVDIFMKVIEALLKFSVTIPDIIIVIRILQSLTETKRFQVSLAFLSTTEKAHCKNLLDKLSSSINSKKEALADENITESTVFNLKNLFQV